MTRGRERGRHRAGIAAAAPSWWCYVVLPILLLLLGTTAATTAVGAERSHSIKIGALTDSWGPTPSIVGMRDGLVALGYREREQFEIGVRFTRGDVSALPAAARDLVRYQVDLLFVMGVNAAKAAQSATQEIPIVFAGAVGDPVALGLVRSFARPGGNITGITDLDVDLAPKRLELFQQMVPGLRRVLFAYDPRDPYGVATARRYREAADRLGISLLQREVHTEEEAAALGELESSDVDGILGASTLSLNIPAQSLRSATRQGIPTMFNDAFWVDQHGALASYGPDLYESGRMAARLIAKILEGADPASLPVESNPKVDFTVSVKTADALGLTLPPAVLLRANRVVE